MEEVLILHCTECNQPLCITTGRGAYCVHCKFPPSMQDTYLLPARFVPNLGDKIQELEEISRVAKEGAERLKKTRKIESIQEVLDKIKKVY